MIQTTWTSDDKRKVVLVERGYEDGGASDDVLVSITDTLKGTLSVVIPMEQFAALLAGVL
jgi:hypothetical protein